MQVVTFYLQSYRKGILTFSGSEDIRVTGDPEGPDFWKCFKDFENGKYKPDDHGVRHIVTRHPRILYGTIKGKKSWGLQHQEWSYGVAEGTFTKYELLDEFSRNGIEIPQPFVDEFNTRVWRERIRYHERHG